MAKTIAIDLGTTNSVVAIQGQYLEAGRVFDDKITVVTDEHENTTFPSVTAFNGPRRPDVPFSLQVVVGHVAKQRMRRSQDASEGTPIAFVKRYMGMEKTFPLGDRECRPEEISGFVVHELIKLAERRLGDAVERVLITVPAYFKGEPQKATRDAAAIFANRYRQEEAEFAKSEKGANILHQLGHSDADIERLKGMEPVEVLDLLLEPVAAAHAYCDGDPRSNLRIMVYDLGGGTFDITVLEKRDETFDVYRDESGGIHAGDRSDQSTKAAFGGNALLGGYNFDKAIVQELLAELSDRYTLDLDVDSNAADRSRYNKLLHMAEEAKLTVSGGSTKVTEIHESNIFNDQSTSDEHADGRPVSIHNRRFARSDLNRLIAPDIVGSVKLCRDLLEKVRLRPDQLDEVILVGGSSKIQLIKECLETPPDASPPKSVTALDLKLTDWKGGLGRQVQLFSPDLAVAIGAAHYARQGPPGVPGLKLTRVQAARGGRLFVRGSTSLPAAATAAVRREDGEEVAEAIGENGEITIDGEIDFEHPGRVTVEVRDAAGKVLATCISEVARGAEAVGPEIPKFLTKDLALQLHDEVLLIAGEGERLPFRYECDEFRTAKPGESITIPLLEDMQVIADLGELGLGDFAVPVPSNHAVRVAVDIDPSGQISAAAHVRVDGKDHDGKISIRFEPRPVRSKEDLLVQLTRLRERLREDIEERNDEDMRMEFGSPIKDKLDHCQRALAEIPPETLVAERDLLEVRAVFREFSLENLWIPSWDQFTKRLEDTADLAAKWLPDQVSKVEAIGRAARQAYKNKNRSAWAKANADLKKTHSQVMHYATNRPDTPDLSPRQWRDGLLAWIGEYRDLGREEVTPFLDEAERRISEVNLDAGNAINELITIRDECIRPVQEHLEDGVPLAKKPGRTHLRRVGA